MMTNEQVYSLAVENLLRIEVPERAKYIRSMINQIFFFFNSYKLHKLTNNNSYVC